MGVEDTFSLHQMKPLSSNGQDMEEHQGQQQGQKFFKDNAASISTLMLSGVVGVLLKHGLSLAFSSQLESPFHEFPANMVGCFLVGFFSSTSTPAAAVVGSVTSFAPWIQALASAFLAGHWLFAVCSLVTGLELSYMSFKVGLDIAEMLQLPQFCSGASEGGKHLQNTPCALMSLGIFSWLLVALLAAFDCSQSRRQLWLACIVAPHGVWLRQLLASKLNDPSRQALPLGTWLANLIASALQAGLLIINSPDPATVITMDAFRTGFTDNLGTISTVVAEAHQLHNNKEKSCRAYLYALSTLLTCLLVAFIISTTSSTITSSFLEPGLVQAISS